MKFFQRLTQLRKKKGLTQEELADLLGISRSAISLYEIDKREPDFETLKRLAQIFDCSTDFLLGNTNNPNIILKDNVAIMTEKNAQLTEEELREAMEYLEKIKKFLGKK